MTYSFICRNIETGEILATCLFSKSEVQALNAQYAREDIMAKWSLKE